MTRRAHKFGVDLRPHLKTSKSEHIGRLATAGHSGGITVSTLKEAEYFASKGFSDITYAVCITPDKLDRVAKLTAQGHKLHLITDSVVVAQAISQHPGSHSAFLEIDCGEHRTGVSPDTGTVLEIAKILNAAPTCTFMGVLTHGGHSYACKSQEEIRAVAKEEREAVLMAAERIRGEGLDFKHLSIGSTPTAVFAESFDGVTEMRPGVYLLGDMFQVGLGTCKVDDVSATVLSTVISHQRAHNRLVIDAGGLALSKDRSTQDSDFDINYGVIAEVSTGLPIKDLKVASVHQEHGEVSSTEELPWDLLPVGSKVRVLVNHICMTAAMYDRYFVVAGNDEVIAEWPRTNGW